MSHFFRSFICCAFLAFPLLLNANEGLALDPRLTPLSDDRLGPFVSLDDGSILSIDTDSTSVSADGGKTWSAPRPIFAADQKIQVSNERAMLRTRDGTIIAAFMNLAERNWTWDDARGDAQDAILPTYVMRSVDDGKTWQNLQKLHDEWSGAVRDMVETKDGRAIFTAMKMQHHPGRHAVLSYSSTDAGVTWNASNLKSGSRRCRAVYESK